MTIRKPNRVTNPKRAVLNGTRTSHSSMPRACGRWHPEGPSREPGGAPEDTTLPARRGNDDTGECGAPLTLGPRHDPYQTTCDQAGGHYPGTGHAGPHPLGTRPGDRITWRGGGRCAGDPLPYEITSEAWQEPPSHSASTAKEYRDERS